MAESSVLSMLVIGQTDSCFHVYKITNTRRPGLFSQLGPSFNFMNGMIHHYLSSNCMSTEQTLV